MLIQGRAAADAAGNLIEPTGQTKQEEATTPTTDRTIH